MVRLIAAIDSKRGLATDSGIPWDLPTDRAMYRALLKEGITLMGAGTYEPKAKPSGNMPVYVLTHRTQPLGEGYQAVHDIATFFREHAGKLINDIGGAGLYQQTLQYADELILTQVEGDFRCTKFFPAYHTEFELTQTGDTQTENGTNFRFETWRRKLPVTS